MGTRTLLIRLEAALASCAAQFWSELLDALAVAGQAAAGMRSLPPDPPGADDGRVNRRPGAAPAEWLPDDVQ